MRVSLLKDEPLLELGETLVKVEVSETDDPPIFTYSHSFKYKVPSSEDKNGQIYGEIVVYTNDAASNEVNGEAFSFDLERCCSKECKRKNKDECPVTRGKTNRVLVADVFHTKPKQDTLQYFGAALFKALFSGHAKRLLQETKPTHPNGRIFLQLNDFDDLDAIPWEYAKDGTTFLVHHRKFARLLERPQDPLPKLPLRIVVVAPDPLDHDELNLADLHLGDQFQNFINDHHGASIKISLEPVLPATVSKMNSLLSKHDSKMASVLHFMGHCVAAKDDKKARGLLFEDEEAFKCEIANTQRLIDFPENLRLAFLSACDSREVARDLIRNGVRNTIGSYCPLPDDITRKFEATFYRLLAQGLSLNEAMRKARMHFADSKELRETDYLSGAMILYSTSCQTTDIMFLRESGELKIELNMFPNNLDRISITRKFFGRREELVNLNGILRRMATRMNDSSGLCTITGIGGQGKTSLAREAVHRASHLFPGGIFFWQFDDGRAISVKDYLWNLVDVIFSKDIGNALRLRDNAGEVKELGQVISEQFKASTLLVIDHADTLKHAAAEHKGDAVALVAWLKEVISRRDIAIKILATSCENLGWPGEKVIPLNGLTDSDVHSGCKLFIENLTIEAREKIKETNETTGQLLRDLVRHVDGHPSSIILLGRAASRKQYQLKDFTREDCGTILANEDVELELKRHFQPTIDGLVSEQYLMLAMSSLFTGPLTAEVLVFIRYFVDYGSEPMKVFDYSLEEVERILEQLYYQQLFYKENEKYRIPIGLREGVRQHNTKLIARLCLPITGVFSDIFIFGVASKYENHTLLEWQLHNIQANVTSGVTNMTLGIQYYNIVDNPDTKIPELKKDAAQQRMSLHGLVVFVRQASEPFHDILPQFCMEQIISIIQERSLPFILCLKYTNAKSAKQSTRSDNQHTILWQKAMKSLQASLKKTHLIVRMEPSLYTHKKEALENCATGVGLETDDKNKVAKTTFKIDFDNINSYGEFVGRKLELQKLSELLCNRENRYITIRGFGGIGKTALAIQAVKSYKSGRVLVQSLAGNPSSDSVISKLAELLNVDTTAINLKTVLRKLESEETILLYLDNMEDIKQAEEKGDDVTKADAKVLMRFFHQFPKNVKILATSRIALGWPNEKTVYLDGLAPQEGMQVFRQWAPDRLVEIDDDSATEISRLATGHPLSIRLLGGMFNNSAESIHQFIEKFGDRLQQAKDFLDNRYDSVDSCIQYSYDYLDSSLHSFLLQLRLFQVPFTATLVKKAFNHGTTSATSAKEYLHKLWQQSWLNELKYDPTLGDWRPKFMEEDTKFYTLHPRLRDFLSHKLDDNKDANPDAFNDPELQFYIALCYGTGFGVLNNLGRQIEWCTKAATNGHLEAQLTLAVCYEQGASGVTKDQDKALDWYLKAAKAGDKRAQEELSKYWSRCAQDNAVEPLEIKFDLSLPLLHRATEYDKVILVKSLLEQPSAKVDAQDRRGRTPLYIAAEKGHVEILKLLGLEFNANADTKDNDGRTPLHRAAENRLFEVIWVLVVELGADANAKDNNGQTPLHRAAANGHAEIVRLLVAELGAEANVKDRDGRTPLHWAADNGHIKVVRLLIAELGMDRNEKDSNGRVLLHRAVDNGFVEVIRLLVTEFGVDADTRDSDGRTLLHRSAGNGQLEIMKLLVAELGADINAKCNDGRTLLYQAAENGDVKVVRLLMAELGANAKARSYEGRTPVHGAADNGRVEIVRLLVSEFGVDVNVKDKDGLTSLHRATDNGHFETMRLLVIELGADVNAKDNDGRTPLHRVADNELTEAMKLLVTKLGADVNIKDDNGRTLLHRATKNEHVKVMKLLVAEFEVDANVKDNDGQTSLHRAAENEQVEIVRLLVAELGADANVKDNDGRTPLHRAAENGQVEMVRLLVAELGANTNIKDNDGRTPLHRAAENEQVEIMRLLVVEFGADANIKDNDGRTPLHQAVENEQIVIMRMLVAELGADANIKDNKGRTPLLQASENKQVEIIRLLVAELNVDTHVKDNNGRTLLHQVEENERVEFMRLLLTEFGAVVETKDIDGLTMLYTAIRGQHFLVMRLLMILVRPRELKWIRTTLSTDGVRALAESLKWNMTLTELNLTMNSINPEGACTLAKSLKKNTTLTELNLIDNEIGAEGACALAESLKQNTTLTNLNLQGCKIGDEGASALAESLKQNITLTNLNLYYNKISVKGAHALAESLKQNSTLTELNLANNEIGTEGASTLAKSLKQNTSLSNLNLYKNAIGVEGAYTLAESLKYNITLTNLNLEDNNISIKGTCALAESLKQNTTLIYLNLHYNEISNKGAYALVESLKQNMTLTSLNLGYNKINIEGVYTLAEYLKQNITLTKLNLCYNRFGTKGACILAESLKQNITLINLNLYMNKIDDEGACALAESLKQNITLTELNLYYNMIGVEGTHALAESLKQNKTLTNLNLGANKISDDGASAIAESLKQNTTLTDLNIEENFIGAKGACTLAESLKQNMTLTKLNLTNNRCDQISIKILNRNKALSKLFEIMNLSVVSSEAEANANNKSRTQLHMAEIRKALTDFGKDVNVNGGLMPLHVIAAHGHIGLVKLLADEFGTGANYQDSNGWTPLHMAAARGYGEVVKFLVTVLEADPNTKDNDGRTPLHRAAGNGHTEVVRLLVTELGADVTVKDNYGCTSLHWAAYSGNIEVLRLLVTKFKADVRAKELLTDINSKSDQNVTPLHYAASGGYVELAKCLVVDFGADVHAKDNDGDEPVAWAIKRGHVDMVRTFVEFGADTNTKSNYGNIPLHYAASNGYVEMVKVLVCEFGANLDAENEKGLTALQLAKKNEHSKVVDLIKNELGADRNKDGNSEMLIDGALRNTQAQPVNQDAKQADSTIAIQSQENVTLNDSDGESNPLGNGQHRGHDEGLFWKTTVEVVSTGAVICIVWLLWTIAYIFFNL